MGRGSGCKRSFSHLSWLNVNWTLVSNGPYWNAPVGSNTPPKPNSQPGVLRNSWRSVFSASVVLGTTLEWESPVNCRYGIDIAERKEIN